MRNRIARFYAKPPVVDGPLAGVEPEDLLDAAEAAVAEGEKTLARWTLLIYYVWRQSGAEEPFGGDEQARRLAESLSPRSV